MDPHDGAVDHLDLPIMCLGHGIHQAVPDAGFPPAVEAIVGRRVGPITLGQVPPWSAGSQHPEDAPFITRQSFCRFGPDRPCGNTGSMIDHSKSVRS